MDGELLAKVFRAMADAREKQDTCSSPESEHHINAIFERLFRKFLNPEVIVIRQCRVDKCKLDFMLQINDKRLGLEIIDTPDFYENFERHKRKKYFILRNSNICDIVRLRAEHVSQYGYSSLAAVAALYPDYFIKAELPRLLSLAHSEHREFIEDKYSSHYGKKGKQIEVYDLNWTEDGELNALQAELNSVDEMKLKDFLFCLLP